MAASLAVWHRRLPAIDAASVAGYAAAVKSRGLLFLVLAIGLAALGIAAGGHGEWVITIAALALALWMADLSRRDLLR